MTLLENIQVMPGIALSETTNIELSQNETNNQLASKIAVSDNYLVIGSRRWDQDNKGKADIYNASTGTLIKTLTGNQGGYGGSVAASGNLIVVGAFCSNTLGTGSVDIYDAKTDFSVTTINKPDDQKSTDAWFGVSVALLDDKVIVGNPDTSDGTGCAYVFNTAGSLLTTLSPAEDFVGKSSFGDHVAISSDYIIVASNYSINVYTIDGSTLLTTLNLPSGTQKTISSLSVFGNNIAVGVSGYEGQEPGQDIAGIVLLYGATTGQIEYTFERPNGKAVDIYFGSSTAMINGSILIASPTASVSYLYDETGKLLYTFSPTSDLFEGASVAASQSFILYVSRESADASKNIQASVYRYLQPSLTLAANTSNSEFGKVVTMNGDNILIGAPSGDGCAFLFNTGTDNVIELKDPTSNQNGEFGGSLALSKKQILVGAKYESGFHGKAFLFDINGNLSNGILNPNPSSASLFGSSVSISEENLIVGDSGSSKAYLYDSNANLLNAFTTDDENSDFGGSVSLSINSAVVAGAYSNFGGSVYLENTITYQQQLQINNPKKPAASRFGYEISACNDKVLVGAPSTSNSDGGTGAVYLYDNEGKLLQTFTIPNSQYLGLSVSLSENYALIGNPNYNDNSGASGEQSGTAYLYDIESGKLLYQFFPLDPQSEAKFGFSVSVTDNIVLIGEPNVITSTTPLQTGRVYLFQVPK